jgi:hypothetical protein
MASGELSSLGSPVYLVDGVTREPVEATVYRELPASVLDEVEAAWGPSRREGARRLVQAGRGREVGHGHWDWRNKTGRVSTRYYNLIGVECGSHWQGLMAIPRASRASRLDQAAIVYVDYLETAPWNFRPFRSPPQYSAVGSLLLAEAVRISRELGHAGRIGLHALEEAESFYENKIGMTRVGQDPNYGYLVYFEFTEAAVVRFLPPDV